MRMIDERTTDLLWRWARYVINGNKPAANRMVGSYAERIGGDSYGDAYAPEVDMDIIWLDGIIRDFPVRYRTALWVSYVQPGPVKSKIPQGWNKTDYDQSLKFARQEVDALYLRKIGVDVTASE